MNDSDIHWAINTLKEYKYLIENTTPKKILATPWSEVYRFRTNKGLIYFKKVPPALSLEPKIIRVLHEQFYAKVPLIIADNHELNCFLMHNAGIQLHHFFNQTFQADLLIQVMLDYTALQMITADKVDLFLDMGIPDWRLEQLPMLYQELIAQEKLLIDDGLNKKELKKLAKLGVKLVSICEQLSQYNIPDTLSHCDFHDKNILVDSHSHQTTMIDLGEVAITHPFFSFHNCLYRAKENFSLTDKQYHHLQEACFKNWLSLESKAHLYEILSIIQQCWSIHSVLGEYRLMKSVDPESFKLLNRQGRLANNLRYWLEQY